MGSPEFGVHLEAPRDIGEPQGEHGVSFSCLPEKVTDGDMALSGPLKALGYPCSLQLHRVVA